MRATLRLPRRVGFAALALATSAAALGAQLPNASPAAFGMAGNYTAKARGYEAVAWNPANLGMPGRPFLSLGAVVFGGTLGMDPVDFRMLHAFSDSVVDSLTRSNWLGLVKASGRQRTRIDGGITPFALSVGPIGFQVGTAMYTNVDFSPDMFEAFMFGNAGNNGGNAKTLDLTGTGISAAVISGGGVSFALPVPFKFTGGLLPNEHLAVALTGKYVVGNAIIFANDGGSAFGANSVTVNFPTILPDSNWNGQLGVGTGADLSAAWSAGSWRVGFLAENVFNTFKWDTTKLAYTTNYTYFDKDTSYSQSADKPFGSAPKALRDRVVGNVFKPAFNIGVAFDPVSFLTITGDVHQQTGDDNAISIGPKNRTGVGVELRIIPFIPLRAGIASVTDGWQAGAGFGIHFLGYELGLSGSMRRRGAATESGIMVGLVGIGH